jgi:hypothetical protein
MKTTGAGQETLALEQRGVEIIPKDERTFGFWDLFVIWGGFYNVTNSSVASLALANMTGWLRVRTSTIASVAGILLTVASDFRRWCCRCTQPGHRT